jgi:hypothetical protein
MPRYFFHQIHGEERIEDHEGSVHATLDGARLEALAGALEIMVNRLWKGEEPNHSRFEIADLAGNVVLIVPFAEAINRGAQSGSIAEKDVRRDTR